VNRITNFLAGTAEKRIAFALLSLCAVLYIPLAGNYGMWDPWESHYGEVARQMAMRNDWISLWWPGSPLDRMEFWSKPVLTFWIEAIALKLVGIEWANPAASEMVQSWRPEWACRIPHVLLSIGAIWAVWTFVQRLAGKRTAALAALVLATSSQWAFITRQAMTDMPFVSPMTIALCFAGLALVGPEEERELELPRGQLFISCFKLSWPRATSFYVFVVLFAAVCIPQFIVNSIQLVMDGFIFNYHVRMIGLVPMLPYIVAFVGGLWWCARARNQRQVYLFSAYLLGALATLAKGPAGILLPGLVLVIFLIVAGRWRDIIFKLELLRGTVIFIAAACPWYHAMLIRHWTGFWNEFIGDNYVRRAEGRHGDRGTFEYYLQYIGYGMFPWSGIVTVGGALALPRLRQKGPRTQLTIFALTWFLVELTTMTVVNTKFHHYILPALPALAILAGLFLDELLTQPTRAQRWALGLIGLPLTLLCGRDLAAFPPRMLWMFNYDYVNAPGTGRPWPLKNVYGDRYEYGDAILIFAVVASLALVGLIIVSWLTRTRREEQAETPPPATESQSSTIALRTLTLLAGTLIIGIISGPATPNGLAPTIPRFGWLVPTLMMLVWLSVLLFSLINVKQLPRQALVALIACVAVTWTGFILDKMLIELSPHWAQKHVIASYYAKRKSADEPLIAWQLYWRGENFYTRNEIWDPGKPLTEKSVFLGDRNAENMQKYFADHKGKKVFFVVERARFETLRGLLPTEARPSLKIEDESNNKLYLASATLGPAPSVLRKDERTSTVE
jgi:4-amino-4-deoxy-L-arabinose transferase-like glycosyltransferase